MLYLIGILSVLLVAVSTMHFRQKKQVLLRISELNLAYKKANFRNQEKKKRAMELINANQALIIKNEEKNQFTDQLLMANAELVKIEVNQAEYIEELEKMMYMISHEVRQPITHLQGLSNLFDDAVNSSRQNLDKIIEYMRSSVHSLDVFTRDLTKYVSKIMQKRKERV